MWGKSPGGGGGEIKMFERIKPFEQHCQTHPNFEINNVLVFIGQHIVGFGTPLKSWDLIFPMESARNQVLRWLRYRAVKA